ncbi:hypothetical protein VDG1235_3452 [Verrucomicrobiia bacterium DG1235]|nr:hypothetical protein VDG1235_3452 [Verrucomicrobiae bacterium DG1235]
MPYRISWKPHYVIFQYYGCVTSEDIIESNKQVYGDPRFDDLRWELVNFDQTESVAFRPQDIRLIAFMDKAAAHSNPHITIAFVGKTEVLDEAVKAYDSAGAHPSWQTVHFDSEDEAIKYITQS